MSSMSNFSHEWVWTLLNSPCSISELGLKAVIDWCRPKRTNATNLADAVIDSGLLATKSEVFRKVKEGALKWNGCTISDPNQKIGFLDPGWGVVQLGKRTHRVVLKGE